SRSPEQIVAFFSQLAEEFPTSKGIQLMAAGIQMEQEQWAAAQERLEHALGLWPDDVQARLALVRCWTEQGEFEKAEAEARRLADTHHELAPLVALSVAEALEKNEQTSQAL